jgi:hypothetical protein
MCKWIKSNFHYRTNLKMGTVWDIAAMLGYADFRNFVGAGQMRPMTLEAI